MESFLKDVERRAFRIARYSTGDTEEALDLVQDAMLKLVKTYADRPGDEWPPLFYRILDNGNRFSLSKREHFIHPGVDAFWRMRNGTSCGTRYYRAESG